MHSARASESNVKGDIRGYDARTGDLLWTFRPFPQAMSWRRDMAWQFRALYRQRRSMGSDVGRPGTWTCLPARRNSHGDYYGGARPRATICLQTHLLRWTTATGRTPLAFPADTSRHLGLGHPSAPILADLPTAEKLSYTLRSRPWRMCLIELPANQSGTSLKRRCRNPMCLGSSRHRLSRFPVKPAPYDRQGFSDAEYHQLHTELLAKAREAIKPFRMSELFTPPSLAEAPDGTQGTLHLPHATGGANWEGGAYDPETGILYVPSRTGTECPGPCPSK